MAIIYTYPIKSDPASSDTILISDTEDGNKTKQVTIHDIRGATVSGVSSIIAGTPNVTLSPAAGTGDVTISVSTPTPPVVVDDFTNTNGVFVSFGTENTNATGSVTVGTVDLSATGLGSPSSNYFLRGDNTWAIPPTGGTMSDFNIEADSGGATTIGDGGTVDIAGGTGIATTNSVGTITITNEARFTSLELTADSGSAETILDGDTITIAGGTGLSSAVSATDTVTINLDNTAVTAGSYTNANITVDAQGRLISASDGAAASVNGELLYSTNWETTTGSDTNPSTFAIPVFAATGDRLEQLEFNPAVGGVGTGTKVYGFCNRPDDATNIVRVIVQFTAESSTAGDEKTAVGLHHADTDQTGAALDYGWHTVGDMDEGSLGNMVRYKYTFDIPVASLLNSGGTSAGAGDPCFFYVKARSFGAAPDIIFGAQYTSNPSTTLASSQMSAGPCIVDVYEIQNDKYTTNPTPALEEEEEGGESG